MPFLGLSGLLRSAELEAWLGLGLGSHGHGPRGTRAYPTAQHGWSAQSRARLVDLLPKIAVNELFIVISSINRRRARGQQTFSLLTTGSSPALEHFREVTSRHAHQEANSRRFPGYRLRGLHVKL